MASKYQPLTKDQIQALKANRCHCNDWSKISAVDGLDPAKITNITFAGQVKLGKNIQLTNINLVENYHIEDDVFIENVNTLVTHGKSSFGNGLEINVLDETGSRAVPIYDQLSAHVAYIITFYRHRPKLIDNLKKLITDYTASVTSSMGCIGKGSKITNCQIIKNIKTGPSAIIDGAEILENATLNSSPDDPVYIGPAVIARNFIASTGAKISDGALVKKCFIGQASELANHCNVENSLFFANSICYESEIASVFAAPYTVTHHKATLLIGLATSFYNAGSGSNQSNHLYKLGPIHYGILERGGKTGSSSYLLLPVKTGPFNIIIGKHNTFFDTSDLPFSYIQQERNRTVVLPARNLTTSGTYRDTKKWPARDKRKGPNKNDLIIFDALSPFTVQKIITACKILDSFDTKNAGRYIPHETFVIKKSSINKGRQCYQLAIDSFLADCLIENLKNVKNLKDTLTIKDETGSGQWIDLAGLLAPKKAIEDLLNTIENSKTKSLEEITVQLKDIYNNYKKYSFTWALRAAKEIHGDLNTDKLIEILEKGKTSRAKFTELILKDAQKESSYALKICFGHDGDQETKDADFANTRGNFENNPFVIEIKTELADKTKATDKLIAQLKAI